MMGKNPSNFKGRRNPVEQVTWNECQQFLEKLNLKVRWHRGKFLLPSESQWEYACRAGSTTKYYFGDDKGKLPDYAWFDENSKNTSHPVGQKKPNAWGLFDMHGNVWEYCQDWFAPEYYENSPSDDPTGPASGSEHVSRGGCWAFSASCCCSSARIDFRSRSGSSHYVGVRVALSIQIGD
jgi:formylglycine-generating enzyme required for sulfatase activity